MGQRFDRYFDAHVTGPDPRAAGRARARDWCDNRATPIRGGSATVVTNALEAALADPSTTIWQRSHAVELGQGAFSYGEHRPLAFCLWSVHIST